MAIIIIIAYNILFRILDQRYPSHFHTDLDLKNIKDLHQYTILSKFVKHYNRLKYGGDLLPDLVNFYMLIHQDLSNLITEEEAKNKSLKEVLNEYLLQDSDQHLLLYKRVKGKQSIMILV